MKQTKKLIKIEREKAKMNQIGNEKGGIIK